MSTIAAPSPEITLEQLAKMPDGDHYELVDGRLVEHTLSMVSSSVAAEIIHILKGYCKPAGVFRVLDSECGFACFPGEPNKLRKPDVSCIRADRVTTEQFFTGYVKIPPDLAVEVVSTHDLAYEVDAKVDEYLAAGVPLVWVVNPLRRSVFVNRRGGAGVLLREGDELTGEDVLPGFRCRVVDFFEGIPLPPRVTGD